MKDQITQVALEKYFERFKYFFNDYTEGRFADSTFKRKVAASFDCFIHKENDHILSADEKASEVYFINEGFVAVTDPKNQFRVARLVVGSFFGEDSALTDEPAGFNFFSIIHTPSANGQTVE